MEITKIKPVKKIRNSRADKFFVGFNVTFLTLLTIAMLYPLIYVLSCSFSSAESLVKGQVFIIPVNFSLDGYTAVFNTKQVWQGYLNSIIYTVTGTIVGVVVTIIGSFVLSRKEFPLRVFVTVLFMITMFFSGGLLPLYILIKTLGMYNTIWAIILPGGFSVWLSIIGRTFIKSSIPEELFEATSLDGGNYFQYFVQVVLPLSKPILAVLALNFAVGQWNSYFSALLFLKDDSKYPLQIVLRNIIIANIFDANSLNSVDVTDAMKRQYLVELLKYSLIIISSIPLLAVYPFIQRYFIKGVMIGSIKG